MPVHPDPCLFSASSSEWNVVVSYRWGLIDLEIQENSGCMIEEFVSIHENHVSSHAGVQLLDEPRLRCSCDLAGGNDEDMIEEHLAVRVRIEDWMLDRHLCLRQNVRNVLAPPHATGVDLLFLYLCAKVEPVPGG